MGNYRGNYQGAFRLVNNVQLTVGFKSILGGSLEVTSYQDDSLLIPPIWLNNTVKAKGCRIELLRLRLVRLFVDEQTYLQVPLIFRENSPEANQFFYDASLNSAVLKIGLYPEIVKSSILESWVTS